MSRDSGMAGSAARTSIAIFGSRILGLVRDVVLNSIFGAGAALDAFWTAFRVPNLLRDLLAEGALSAAFTTTFSKTMTTEGKEQAFALANRMLTSMAVGISIICVLGIIFAEPIIVYTIGSGFDPAKQVLTVELTRILFPFIWFVSLAAIYMGLLNSLGSFALPASASSVFNIVSILSGLGLGYYLDPDLGDKAIYGFAVGTVIGGVAQLIVQMPRAGKDGLQLRPRFDWNHPKLVKVYRLALPAIFGVAAVQLNVVINMTWASHMGDGAVTYFNNAFRLMQLPIGMFGVAIGMVALPSVSISAAEENMQHFRWRVVEGLKLALFLTVPASIGLCIFSEPIIGMIYEHGRFLSEDVAQTALLLQAFTLGLAGYACIKVLAPTFYALDMPRVPVMVSVRAIGLNLLFTFVFIRIFDWGLISLPLSVSIVALLNLFQLSFALSRKLGSLTSGTNFPGFFVKMILLSIAIAAVAWVTIQLGYPGEAGFLERLLFLGISIPLIGTVYFYLAHVLRIEEGSRLLSTFRKKVQPAGADTTDG
ncbi:MAG: murein biosynthesis integral membrane protein MurJ [Verrucomicrobiota bacterium]